MGKKIQESFNPLYHIPVTIWLIVVAVCGVVTWMRILSGVGAIFGIYILYNTYPRKNDVCPEKHDE